MQFDSIDAIRGNGFEGFVRISTLQNTRCVEVPKEPGVYLVVRTDTAEPSFLEESIGGHFKGKNPTVPVSELHKKWVKGAMVLYIGKAGPTPDRTLRIRLDEYMCFGRGCPIGHSGGKRIWQLCESSGLLVCWKTTPPNVYPLDEESILIHQFENEYDKIPFANGRRNRRRPVRG